MFSVAAVQMTSGGNVGANLILAKKLLSRAVESGANLIVLPECFSLYPKNKEDLFLVSEELGAGRVQNFLSEFAKSHGVWIVGGTIPIKSHLPDRVYASCIVWNDKGEPVGFYHKIHLFDVDMPVSGLSHQGSQVMFQVMILFV